MSHPFSGEYHEDKQLDGGLWQAYEQRVMELEREGLTTSDAQAVVDVEYEALHGRGWELKREVAQ